ncbi:MAG: hypothetical protein J7K13_00215 [Thermoplasmata archaeon]|nr:hypothetical protein [Thermoplasmata archaeon]
MKKGELYVKHVRGSKYAFGYGKIFYKYPNGAKNYAVNDMSRIVDEIVEVRDEYSGRIIINEQKEIVTYRKTCHNQWMPYYVGTLSKEPKFEGIENNPRNLRPGLLWTGFASHHGSEYIFTITGKIYFKETFSDKDGSITTKKYLVRDVDEDLIERLKYFKIDSGRFHINEFGHVWAPVPEIVIKKFYRSNIIHVDDIHEQFRNMTPEQKNTIKIYSNSRYSNSEERWFPVYIGKYTEPLIINRQDRPHIINREEDIYI